MSSPTTTANTARDLDPAKALGIRVHNLVLTKDSGNHYAEFRVQCEIRLPKPLNNSGTHSPEEVQKAKDDADRVLAALAEGTPDSLREVEQIVTPYIHDQATKPFRDAVRNAFLDHIKLLEEMER